MARLTHQDRSTKITNRAGGQAYAMPLHDTFVSRVMTTLWNEPNYYGETTTDLIKETDALLIDDPEFVLKAAIFARENMQLRTVPVFLLGRYIAKKGTPTKDIPAAVKRVCTRPDQLQELVGYLNNLDKSIARKSHSLQRGLSKCLKSYDAYQFGKYGSSKNRVPFRDLLNIAHPKPENDEQSALFKQVLENRVPAPQTWEVLYMQAKTNEDKCKVWEHLLDTYKLPYMALLRNLRNMLKCGLSDEYLFKAMQYLTNKDKVRGSKQWPYRFYSAYRMLQVSGEDRAQMVLPSIALACNISVENIPKLPGKTMISADNSGSMEAQMSAKSVISHKDVANLFQAAMVKNSANSTIGSVFAEYFSVVPVNVNNDVISIANLYKNTYVGMATYAHKIFNWLIESNQFVDRVIIFTDLQIYSNNWNIYPGYSQSGFMDALNEYRDKINPDVWLHWINLASYAESPTPQGHSRISVTNGWSDRAIQYFLMVEDNEGNMVKDIKGVTL